MNRELTIRVLAGAIRPLKPLVTVYKRISATMTVGVRALVVDSKQQIVLVRHRYLPGWHLPGGGVEVGEFVVAALTRELREEAGVDLLGKPELRAVFHNTHASPRDHVFLFIVRDFQKHEIAGGNLEIVECRAFPLGSLPPNVAPATKRRIEEFMGSDSVDEVW